MPHSRAHECDGRTPREDEPAIEYSEQAAAKLDRFAVELPVGEWDEIVDALELIEHHPESAEARRGQIRSGTESLWKVDTRTPVSILWRMEDDEPTVVEVMAWPPQ